MKKLKTLLLLSTLMLPSSCAVMKRHPVVTGMVAGTGAAVLLGLKYHDKGCPSTYDGHAYQGTPWGPYPCPQYAPGGKK